MNKKEFEFLLKQGEGLKLEFKENFNSKDIAKEFVAFSNTEGGRIFIGIDNTGVVKGIKITNDLKSEIQNTARNCDPSIPVELEMINSVLIVNVDEGINKPYRCSSGFFNVMAFLLRNLRLEYKIETAGPREEVLEIPEDALREAVVNSMAHRDYNERGANVQIDPPENYPENYPENIGAN